MTWVRNSDPSLGNSRNLSWVGQVRPVESQTRVQKADMNGSNLKPYLEIDARVGVDSAGEGNVGDGAGPPDQGKCLVGACWGHRKRQGS